MSDFKKDIFALKQGYNSDSGDAAGCSTTDVEKKRFKKELMEIFRKYGYLEEVKDYEIKIRTTSGNVAWINIKGIETIK